MTALSKYQRLEALGLWRASEQDQRRDVVVSIGDATLVISDTADRAITHWSLAAVERSNAGQDPAIFHPQGDANETLELPADEAEMIAAIDTLRMSVQKGRPRKGRLRFYGLGVFGLTLAALTVFWVPDALVTQAGKVVPAVSRVEIGTDVLRRIERVAGTPCKGPQAQAAVKQLVAKTGARDLIIVREGVRDSLMVPGGTVVINRALIEDYEDPYVAAGFVLAEQVRAQTEDPLHALLSRSGVLASLTLLTTGRLPDTTLDAYAETVLQQDRAAVDTQALLAAFDAADIRSTPYAYALDVSGESTLPLIEGDPSRDSAPLLSDADWLRLQSICGG